MLMSEFVAKALDEFRLLADDPVGMHPLVKKESEKEYKQLERYLRGYLQSQQDVTHYLLSLKELFARRFYEKISTPSIYSFTPYSKVNEAYLILAKHLAPYAYSEAYDLLMPSVYFSESFYALRPHEFVLIKRDDLFIPINVVDYLDHLPAPSLHPRLKRLKKNERKLIIHHSEEARRYAAAILMGVEKDIIALRRAELVQAIKKTTYNLTIRFSKESYASLAQSLLRSTEEGQELAAMLGEHVPRQAWSACLDVIQSKRLCKAILKVDMDSVEGKTIPLDGKLTALSLDLHYRYELFTRALIYLESKEKNMIEDAKKIPDIMRIVSQFNWVSMLEEVQYQIPHFKRLLISRLQDSLSSLPPHIFDDQLRAYKSLEELANTILDIGSVRNQVHSFRLLSASDLFKLILNFDLDKYKLTCANNARELSEDELLLSAIGSNLVYLSINRKNSHCADDNYVRAYFFMLTAVYKYQRDLLGESHLPSGNSKENKFASCELLQHFLLSDYSLKTFNMYPLNDDLLNESDLASLYTSLSSGTLGSIFDALFKFSSLYYRFMQPENDLPASYNEEEKQVLAVSGIRLIENWQGKTRALAKTMSAVKWKAFMDEVYDLDKKEAIEACLTKHTLHHAKHIDTFIRTLAYGVAKEKWPIVTQEIQLIPWLSTVAGMDVESICALSIGKPLVFEAKFWEQFDLCFKRLLKENKATASLNEARAYSFCLAMTYKRQREKRGDYTSSFARTASLFRITSIYSTATKNDKIQACDALIQFILEDKAQWSEAGLKEYLRKNYKNSAKYESILLADTLGELTRQILREMSDYVVPERYKNYNIIKEN